MTGAKVFLFLSLIFFFSSVKANAFKTELHLYRSRNILSADVRIDEIDRERIITSLKQGLRSEIIFQFRLYKKNAGFFSFFGDTLVIEKRPNYISYRDFFTNQYIIINDKMELLRFDAEDEFVRQLFAITAFDILSFNRLDKGDYFVLSRVTVNPEKLEPPLHLVSLIISIGESSEWVESQIIRIDQ
jgi:hypothetical protein